MRDEMKDEMIDEMKDAMKDEMEDEMKDEMEDEMRWPTFSLEFHITKLIAFFAHHCIQNGSFSTPIV